METNLRQMYGIGVMAFILFLSSLVGLPVLPQLSAELGAKGAEIPLVVSAALATVVLVQFFAGILADRYSRRNLILMGALLGSVSSLLCVAATHWTQLLALRIVGGIADAISMPALLSITASLSADQPGRFFGILRGSQGLSFVAGPAMGSIFSLISLRAPFLVDGSFSFVAFLAAIVFLKDARRAKSEHTLSVFHGLKSTFSQKRVLVYLLMGIAGLFPFGILYSFIPTKAQLLHLAAWQIGAILSGGALIFSLVSYGIGTVSDRFGRRIFVIFSQVVIAASGVGLIFCDRFESLLAFYGLFCVGETISYLLCFVYATEAFDSRYLGTSMGAFDSLMDLSLFVGPLIAVSLYQYAGHMAPVFLLAVIPALLAFPATALWLPADPQKTSQEAEPV